MPTLNVFSAVFYYKVTRLLISWWIRKNFWYKFQIYADVLLIFLSDGDQCTISGIWSSRQTSAPD